MVRRGIIAPRMMLLPKPGEEMRGLTPRAVAIVAWTAPTQRSGGITLIDANWRPGDAAVVEPKERILDGFCLITFRMHVVLARSREDDTWFLREFIPFSKPVGKGKRLGSVETSHTSTPAQGPHTLCGVNLDANKPL